MKVRKFLDNDAAVTWDVSTDTYGGKHTIYGEFTVNAGSQDHFNFSSYINLDRDKKKADPEKELKAVDDLISQLMAYSEAFSNACYSAMDKVAKKKDKSPTITGDSTLVDFFKKGTVDGIKAKTKQQGKTKKVK